MECFCSLRNIQDKVADRTSPFERRCGTPVDVSTNPFEAEIYVLQSLQKTKVVIMEKVQRYLLLGKVAMDTLRILEEVGQET